MEQRRRRGLRRILRWSIVGTIVGTAAWLLRDLDLARLGAALGGADWLLVTLAAALNLVLNTAARTMRWRAVLPPSPRTGRPVGRVALAEIVATGLAANNLMPLRAGEAVRAIALSDREGYPVRQVVAAQVVEKLVEFASLVTAAVPVIVAPSTSRALVGRWLVLAGCVVVAVAVLAAARRSSIGKEDGVVRRTLRPASVALDVLGRPRAVLESYGWGLASEAVDLATIALSLAAVDIHLAPVSWCAILVAVNLAIAVPSTPGQVGVLEAGALLALAGLGVDHDRALAFALLYHGVHVVSFTAAGGLAVALSLRREHRRRVPR